MMLTSTTGWSVVLGLGVGAGLLLIWSGFSRRPPSSSAAGASSGFAHKLRSLGLTRLNPAVFLFLSAVCGLVLACLTLLLTAVVPLAAIVFLAGAFAPWMVLNQRAVRRAQNYAAVWPDVVDALIAQLRSGATIPSALSSLVTFPQPAIAAGATIFARCFTATGNADAALSDLKTAWAQPAADRIVESLRVARDVGGSHVIATLVELGAGLRAENMTRKEINAKQSWVTVAARIGVAAPWIVLIVLSFRPEAVAAFNSPTGILIILAGFVACILAYRLMVSLGRLPLERRSLA